MKKYKAIISINKHLVVLLSFFFLTVSLNAQPTVCLNMIVKNESHVITRCLASIKPLIDYWVIVDTGSTDGTQEIIQEYMKDIPGELFERPWKNFGYNRTEALSLAKQKGDYLLFMDADDWLEYEEGYRYPLLTKDAYMIKYIYTTGSYFKNNLVKANLPLKWEGVVHEYLDLGGPCSSEELQGIRYIYGGDGSSWQDPEKFLKYVKMLEGALEEEPNNARYVFYLAQSYLDAGDPEQAIKYYQKRVELGGWNEEVFCSFLEIAKLQSAQKVAQDIVISSYIRAHRFRPMRLEPIFYLAQLYNRANRHDLAYECIKGHEHLPKSLCKDLLLKEDWIENYGLLFELSICAYYMGHYQESLDACKSLLANNDLPEFWRKQTVNNSKLVLNKIREQSSQTANKGDNNEYFLLVTGCGRSGTGYTSQLLQESGLVIGHERLEKDGCVSWPMALDGEYEVWGPSAKGLHFKHVFHQVRHPLDVISSWHTNTGEATPGLLKTWKYVYDHIPQIKPEEPLLVRCAKYWYYWNLEAEKKAEWRYRIEDINLVVDEMEQRLGVSLNRTAFSNLRKDVNTRLPIKKWVTWLDLKQALTEEDFSRIQAMALKYGYPTED